MAKQMTVQEAQRVTREHMVPGYHSWSTARQMNLVYENASCDECTYAEDVLGLEQTGRLYDEMYPQLIADPLRLQRAGEGR